MGSSSGWSVFIVAPLPYNKIKINVLITAVNREDKMILTGIPTVNNNKQYNSDVIYLIYLYMM